MMGPSASPGPHQNGNVQDGSCPEVAEVPSGSTANAPSKGRGEAGWRPMEVHSVCYFSFIVVGFMLAIYISDLDMIDFRKTRRGLSEFLRK